MRGDRRRPVVRPGPGDPAHPVQRQRGVGDHRLELLERAGRVAEIPGRAVLDEHPPHAVGREVGRRRARQQQAFHLRGPPALAGDGAAGDDQLPGLQHVGAQHPGGRIENRCGATELESPEHTRRQHRHIAVAGRHRRRDPLPRVRILHRAYAPAHAPRQVRKGQQHRQRGRRGPDAGPPAETRPQRADPRRGGQRVQRHRPGHPLLRVAQQTRTRDVHHRPLPGPQPRPRRREGGTEHRDRGQRRQHAEHRVAPSPPQRRHPAHHHQQQRRSTDQRPHRRPRRGHRVGVPDAAEPRHAAERAQRGLGPCREGAHPRRIRSVARAAGDGRRHQPRRRHRTRQRHRAGQPRHPPGPPARGREHGQRRPRRQQRTRRGQARHAQAHRQRRPPGAVAPPHRHGGHHRPRQRRVAHQQAPVPLQQPLRHVRVPHAHRRRHQPGRQPGRRQQHRHQPGAAPAGRPQGAGEQRRHHQAAVRHRTRRRQQRVLRDGPRRGIGQTQRRVRRKRPRGAHRVAQQQVAGGGEQRPEHHGRQREAVEGRDSGTQRHRPGHGRTIPISRRCPAPRRPHPPRATMVRCRDLRCRARPPEPPSPG
ncbi:hypothetical protein YT1_4714 [Rhodococcus ruber]|nr:hypothetical protein YT1_4714 [Rhodococcus ruber]